MPAPDVQGHVVSAHPCQQAVLARDVDRINAHPARHAVIFRKKQRARTTCRKV